MIKKIVIAADSFKGSISSRQFADVCERAISSVVPDCQIVKLPLGDGGEGTVEALSAALDAKTTAVSVADPLLRPRLASYSITSDHSTAVMEMAEANGLTLLNDDERNPSATSSYGTGMMIADALDKGCCHIMLGIGGSATNDGGAGMLGALGARFFDNGGRMMSEPLTGGDFNTIGRIDLSTLDARLKLVKIDVACDVDNPLTGINGATRIFARQKGADDAMIERLETGMVHYADLLAQAAGRPLASLPGAGAAGGLGAALAAIGARLRPGIELVLDAVGFDHHLDGADLVITGEGRIDSQTLMGKTPFGVLQSARVKHVPVIAIGGSVEYSEALNSVGFAGIFSIQTAPVSLADALNPATASRNLADTVRQIIGLITRF